MVSYPICTVIKNYDIDDSLQSYLVNDVMNKVSFNVWMESVYATAVYRRKKDRVENR